MDGEIFMENPSEKMGWFGGKNPPFQETPTYLDLPDTKILHGFIVSLGAGHPGADPKNSHDEGLEMC